MKLKTSGMGCNGNGDEVRCRVCKTKMEREQSWRLLEIQSVRELAASH
jgi:hypothetical protein